MLGESEFLGHALVVAFTMGGFVMFLSGSPYVLIRDLRVPADQYGYYFAGLALSYSVSALAVGRLTPHVGIERMVLIGAVMAVVAGAAQTGLAWTGHADLVSILAPQALYMIAIGFVMPNAIAGARMTPAPQRESRSAVSAFRVPLRAVFREGHPAGPERPGKINRSCREQARHFMRYSA